MTDQQAVVLLAWARDAYRGPSAPNWMFLKNVLRISGRFRSRILETLDYCEKNFPHKLITWSHDHTP